MKVGEGVTAKLKEENDAANYAKKQANEAKKIARNVESGVSEMNNSRKSALRSTNRPGGSGYLSLHSTPIIKQEVKKTDEENEKHAEEKEKLKDAQNTEDAQVKEEKDADKLLN